MKSYKFSFNDTTKVVTGLNLEDAKSNFENRYGFWPSEGLVEIETTRIRPVT